MKDNIIEGSKILIIDDQPGNLAILFDYLDMFNAEVILEQNTEIALKIAESKKPDLILLDIIMPEMNGFEVCKKLKEHIKTKDIPVIFMSALNDTESIVKGFNAGGVDYIVKPVRQEEVIARITNHLRIIRAERELREKAKHDCMTIMAGGICHNFNNILMGIMGRAELSLLDLPENSSVAYNNRIIVNLCERVSGITKKILDYSGHGKCIKEKTDLSILVKEISELLKIYISKNILLKYDLQSDLPVLQIDRDLVSQSLINIVTNSSEAIGNNEGTITVKTGVIMCNTEYLSSCHIKGDHREGLYVYLEVKDTGCGIEEENLNKIFDPFFSTKFTGRGLGLAAVYGIIKNHKGTIKVERNSKKGTCIKLLFPVE
ncbi:MAG: response regulator [Candidatus Eremiobacterota bacterium]